MTKPTEPVVKQEKTFGFIKKKNPQVQVDNNTKTTENNIVSLLGEQSNDVKTDINNNTQTTLTTQTTVSSTQEKPKGGFSFIKSKKKDVNNNDNTQNNNTTKVNNDVNSLSSQLSEINFNQPEQPTKINGLDLNLLNQLYQQNNNYNANMQFQNNYRMNNINMPNNMYMQMNNGSHGVDVNNMNMMMQIQQMNQMQMQQMNMNQIPQINPNQMQQMNVNQIPQMNMNQMAQMNVNQMQQMNPNPIPQMNMNQIPQMNPNMGNIPQSNINPNQGNININQMGAMGGYNNNLNNKIQGGADPYDLLFDPKLLNEQEQPKVEEKKEEETVSNEPKPDPFNNLLDLVKH